MPVNVAFGPAAGLGGQLAFGAGKRQYSDRRDAIEHQSKRQMLSDAMGFAKHLQDARRPEEDQRRLMERMDKQQQIGQADAIHSEGLRRSGAEWNQNQTIKVRKAQIDSLKAAREKIDQQFQEKQAGGMLHNDLQKWAADAYAMSDAAILGSKPPSAMNPFDSIIAEDGEKWAVVDNKWQNLSEKREGRVIEREKIAAVRQQNLWNNLGDIRSRGALELKGALEPLIDERKANNELYAEEMRSQPTSKTVTDKKTGKKKTTVTPGWGIKHPLYAAWREQDTRIGNDMKELRRSIGGATEGRIKSLLLADVGGEGSDGASKPGSSARILAEMEQKAEAEEQAVEQKSSEFRQTSGIMGQRNFPGGDVLLRRESVEALTPGASGTAAENVYEEREFEEGAGFEETAIGSLGSDISQQDRRAALLGGGEGKDTSSPWRAGSKITSDVAHAIVSDKTGYTGRLLVKTGQLDQKELADMKREDRKGFKYSEEYDVGTGTPASVSGRPDQHFYNEGVARDLKNYRADGRDARLVLEKGGLGSVQTENWKALERKAEEIVAVQDQLWHLLRSRKGDNPLLESSNPVKGQQMVLKNLKKEFKEIRESISLAKRYKKSPIPAGTSTRPQFHAGGFDDFEDGGKPPAG